MRLRQAYAALPLLVAAAAAPARPQAAPRGDAKAALASSLDARSAHYAGIADSIWAFAELGYQERKSSALLQEELRTAGFGVRAEFDALPGLSQAAAPERKPIVPQAPGHACGHHLFGTASVAAAVA